MKRVIAAAVVCAGFLVFAHTRADATTEFCPAVLDIAPVSKAAGGSAVYGVQLRALSERQVTATVAFDTTAGWFSTDLPKVTLTQSVRTIPLEFPVDVGLATSPIIDVRFPSAVHLNHAFVTNALAAGDIFHWDERGRVTCTPDAEAWPDPKFSLADVNDLVAPSRSASVVAASPRSALESASCEVPFEAARVVKRAQPAYPDAARAAGASGTAIVAAAIDPDGSLADAWIQGSSDDATLDAAAVAAAQASTYQAGRAYCQTIPSIYYLVVTFDARS